MPLGDYYDFRGITAPACPNRTRQFSRVSGLIIMKSKVHHIYLLVECNGNHRIIGCEILLVVADILLETWNPLDESIISPDSHDFEGNLCRNFL